MSAALLHLSRRQLLSTAAVLGVAAMGQVRAAAEDAEARAERMFSAVGGRAAWVRANNMVLDAQVNRSDEAAVQRTVVAVDFKRPRFRIETTAPGLLILNSSVTPPPKPNKADASREAEAISAWPR